MLLKSTSPFACLSDVLLGWAPHGDGVDKVTGGSTLQWMSIWLPGRCLPEPDTPHAKPGAELGGRRQCRQSTASHAHTRTHTHTHTHVQLLTHSAGKQWRKRQMVTYALNTLHTQTHKHTHHTQSTAQNGTHQQNGNSLPVPSPYRRMTQCLLLGLGLLPSADRPALTRGSRMLFNVPLLVESHKRGDHVSNDVMNPSLWSSDDNTGG
jgi:hypothetical protein